MKICKNKKCKNELSDSAIKCLKCGKDQRTLFKRHPIIIFLFLICILGALLLGRDIRQENMTEEELKAKTKNNIKTEEIYYLGDTFENGYLDVKFLSSNKNFKKHSQYAKVEIQHDILEVEFEFQNISNEEKHITSNDFRCFVDGKEYERFYSVKNSTFSIKLLPKKKIKENVYFQIPVKFEEIKIVYESPYAENGFVEFVIK